MLPKDDKELFYRLALLFVPGVGTKIGRGLLERYGSATDIFKAPLKELKSAGVPEAKVRAFKESEPLESADKEMQYIIKHNINVLYQGYLYPQRLKNCSDAPLLLFYKGAADLDAEKIVAIVGTRKNTDYGVQLCDELIEGLRSVPGMLIVSGLAAGIDSIAHKKCVQLGVPTVGVLGHGHDKMYPPENKALAKQMVEQGGGVLTEFPTGSRPERGNFPLRNRVVAGMSDVTVVVESDIAGGALITAHMAAGYHREVAAFPGRVNDTRSSGCNEIIRTNVAAMVTCADDLLDLMNWNKTRKPKPVQKQLFLDLPPEQQKIVDLLQTKDAVHADELLHHTELPNSQLAATLLQLEMQGLIKALPGKMYRMS